MPRMLNTVIAILAAFDASSAIAATSQIPSIDGIIGGVPIPGTLHSDAKPQPPASITTTPGQLRVAENSGVCETTPGVYQASG
ncbi:hypothetical protein JB92DRAFT_3135969 [Gautieria morchelliformis]|nr:hypothetical protein JB92DRAFT_3135969 [Gautieria morchelliformis]